MRFSTPISLLALPGLMLATGCATGPKVVSPTSAHTASEFDQIKSLAGEWMTTDQSGNQVVGSVFSVSSNGSAVREIMFPGSPHEMTNMYHLDGDSIVATHYCAAGNQPRMRCTDPSGGVFAFEGFDCTNLASHDTEYMASMTLVIKDSRHIRQDWSSIKGGTESEHVSFDLTRRN